MLECFSMYQSDYTMQSSSSMKHLCICKVSIWLPFAFTTNQAMLRLSFAFTTNQAMFRLPFAFTTNQAMLRLPFAFTTNQAMLRLSFAFTTNQAMLRLPFAFNYQSGNAQTFASSHFLVTSLCNFEFYQQPWLHHMNV